MASAKNLISDAFEKLNRSISEEDAHEFASTQLKDVWTAVRAIDSEQRKRRSAQNLARITPFLEGIGKYASVIEVLCNGTPFMPYVWAPIKLMLQLASQHRDIFEALLTAYADIGAALPRFDRYEKAFKENPEFQNVLAAVYSNILEFHQRAYKFFRRRAWHVIFLSVWKDFGGRFNCIINALKKQRDFVDEEAVSISILEAKEARIQMQHEIQQRQRREVEKLEEDEKKSRIRQIQDSVTWLSIDENFQETEYERISSRRHDKTCEWIADEQRMRAWKEDDAKGQFLWLTGKPGAGKSVMCAYVIKTLKYIPETTCCYYFCNSQSTGNIPHQILAIIVLQLIRQHPDVCSLIANEFAYVGANSGMVSLRTLVPKLLDLVQYTRIVIDGIDECMKENQKAILKELQTICGSPASHCKVIFSSRREVHIQQKLSRHPQIFLDGRQEVDLDIRSFVEHKIRKLRTSDQELLSKIKSILVEKANGMFLWVRLVIGELKYCYSDAALEETAESLPKGLQAAYGRILDRIMDSQNSSHLAIRLLGWMACSYRLLKRYEILDGIAFDASNTVLTLKTKMGPSILDLCRPLIEEGPDHTVDFVHFSAKEYILEAEYRSTGPFVLHENAHLDISFSCIAYLNCCISLLPEHSTDSKRASIVVRGFHGLQVYANQFWVKHLLAYCSMLGKHRRQISTELLAQLQLLLKFAKDAADSSILIMKAIDNDISKTPGLEALDNILDIKSLVLNVLHFRAQMNREISEKPLETISFELCAIDPTHFSAVRHYYQQTAEALLDDEAIIRYPGLDSKDLQLFRDTYGASAFVCRYPDCVFSTSGFESSSQRIKHESHHQRTYRCGYSSCIFSTTGFSTANNLKKHNQKYHPVITGGLNLADMLIEQQDSSIIPSEDQENQGVLSLQQQQQKPPHVRIPVIQFTPQEINTINQKAQHRLANTSEQEKVNIKIQVQNRVPQLLQQAHATGQDVAFLFFRNQIRAAMQANKLREAAAAANQQHNSNNADSLSVPIQPQRSENPHSFQQQQQVEQQESAEETAAAQTQNQHQQQPQHEQLPQQHPNAAPGSTPDTIVSYDENGVQWIVFEYTSDEAWSRYRMRCDVESVDMSRLSSQFLHDNSILSSVSLSSISDYEIEHENIGWALAELNSMLRGKKDLLQRAVENWRDNNQDSKLFSLMKQRDINAIHSDPVQGRIPIHLDPLQGHMQTMISRRATSMYNTLYQKELAKLEAKHGQDIPKEMLDNLANQSQLQVDHWTQNFMNKQAQMQIADQPQGMAGQQVDIGMGQMGQIGDQFFTKTPRSPAQEIPVDIDRHEPNLDRTVGDVYSDQLYNSNSGAISTPSQNQSSNSTSPPPQALSLMAQRLQAANNQRLTTQQSDNTPQDRSSFRQGSPLGNSPRSHSPPQDDSSFPLLSGPAPYQGKWDARLEQQRLQHSPEEIAQQVAEDVSQIQAKQRQQIQSQLQRQQHMKSKNTNPSEIARINTSHNLDPSDISSLEFGAGLEFGAPKSEVLEHFDFDSFLNNCAL